MLWYKVPGFTSIEVNEQGDVRSSRTHKLRKQQQTCSSIAAIRKRKWIDVKDPDKPRKKPYVARLVLSAKLGRTLKPWEEACHQNGDSADNRMNNLEVGCRLNNILDEIEAGRLHTSVEQIDRAMQRLQALREKIQ